MRLDTNIYPPAQLTGFARSELEAFHADENLDVFSGVLPNDFVRDIEVEIREGVEVEDNVVMYRAYDAESPIGSLPGFATSVGRIPPLSEKIPLGEYDGIRADQAGDLNRQIERRAGRSARGIARRVARARAEALLDGKVTLDENGVIYEVDFGRDSANNNATYSTIWSNTSGADPIADLITWQAIIANAGYGVGSIYAAQEAVAAALRTDAVIGATIGAAAGVTQASLAQFDLLLAQYGLPPVTILPDMIGGQKVMRGNTVLMLGDTGALGATLWGETGGASPRLGSHPQQR